MEDSSISKLDKTSVNKAKSFSSDPPKKLNNEPVKRKSFNTNEAVKSVESALGRLKKSKLVSGEYGVAPSRYEETPNMFIDSLTSPSTNLLNADNASSMTMNFSHYELIRNLSSSNCNSDDEFSSTTCAGFSSLSEIASRDEHLERYFRSLDMWGKNSKGGTSNFGH